jgi:hypothetical protein
MFSRLPTNSQAILWTNAISMLVTTVLNLWNCWQPLHSHCLGQHHDLQYAPMGSRRFVLVITTLSFDYCGISMALWYKNGLEWFPWRISQSDQEIPAAWAPVTGLLLARLPPSHLETSCSFPAPQSYHSMPIGIHWHISKMLVWSSALCQHFWFLYLFWRMFGVRRVVQLGVSVRRDAKECYSATTLPWDPFLISMEWFSLFLYSGRIQWIIILYLCLNYTCSESN